MLKPRCLTEMLTNCWNVPRAISTLSTCPARRCRLLFCYLSNFFHLIMQSDGVKLLMFFSFFPCAYVFSCIRILLLHSIPVNYLPLNITLTARSTTAAGRVISVKLRPTDMSNCAIVRCVCWGIHRTGKRSLVLHRNLRGRVKTQDQPICTKFCQLIIRKIITIIAIKLKCTKFDSWCLHLCVCLSLDSRTNRHVHFSVRWSLTLSDKVELFWDQR